MLYEVITMLGGTAGATAASGAGLLTGSLPTLLRAEDAPGNGVRNNFV